MYRQTQDQSYSETKEGDSSFSSLRWISRTEFETLEKDLGGGGGGNKQKYILHRK